MRKEQEASLRQTLIRMAELNYKREDVLETLEEANATEEVYKIADEYFPEVKDVPSVDSSK